MKHFTYMQQSFYVSLSNIPTSKYKIEVVSKTGAKTVIHFNDTTAYDNCDSLDDRKRNEAKRALYKLYKKVSR